jgi:hypothetical protein
LKLTEFIIIRPYREEDKAFVLATYLRNTWYNKDNMTTLPKHLWMGLNHSRMDKALPTLGVKVACLSDDQDTILGYCFKDIERPFVYVKLAFRNPEYKVIELLEKAL